MVLMWLTSNSSLWKNRQHKPGVCTTALKSLRSSGYSKTMTENPISMIYKKVNILQEGSPTYEMLSLAMKRSDMPAKDKIIVLIVMINFFVCFDNITQPYFSRMHIEPSYPCLLLSLSDSGSEKTADTGAVSMLADSSIRLSMKSLTWLSNWRIRSSFRNWPSKTQKKKVTFQVSTLKTVMINLYMERYGINKLRRKRCTIETNIFECLWHRFSVINIK